MTMMIKQPLSKRQMIQVTRILFKIQSLHKFPFRNIPVSTISPENLKICWETLQKSIFKLNTKLSTDN